MAEQKVEQKLSSSTEVDKNFDFAASLIKIVALVIALMVMIVSRYALIFFVAAMLPTIFAIFFDRDHHKCLSATICSFNLIGALPYLVRIWESSSVDYISKQILADINTWAVIYGAAVIGQLVYSSLPILIVKIQEAKIHIQVSKLEKQYYETCSQWGIKTNKDKVREQKNISSLDTDVNN
jgi:hypothetical protein